MARTDRHAGGGPGACGLRRLPLAGLLAVLFSSPAAALINPNYTPSDLVRGARAILVLDVSPPEKWTLKARVLDTLKGAPLAAKTITLDTADAEMLDDAELAAAFDGATSARAVLFASRDREGQGTPGAVQIAGTWFSVTEGDGPATWNLDADQEALEMVWAGSARQLARAARQVLEDPTLRFPVKSSLVWAADAKLADAGGPVHALMPVDLGGEAYVLALSEGGDRLWRAGQGGDAPFTEGPALATASRCAAPGDFDGDGRLGLATADRKAVRLVRRNPDGAFAAPVIVADIADVRSLDVIDLDGRSGLVAGAPGGPVLIVPGEGGAWTTRPLGLPDGADPGPGGAAVVADVTDDGRTDVLALYARSLVLYAGGEEAGTFAKGEVLEVDLGGEPRAAVPGDYDQDGTLDVIVGGAGGPGLVRRDARGRWANTVFETGELVRHGGEGDAGILDVAPCDVNADGKQGVALFYARGNPAVFFNRGFACFGLARELILAETRLDGAAALGRGQTAGLVADVTGDGAEDFVAANPAGEVRALLGETDEPRRARLTVALPEGAAGPVTMTVRVKDRPVGLYVIRPGRPVVVNRPAPGPVTLAWKEADGTPRARPVILVRPARVELASEGEPTQ